MADEYFKVSRRTAAECLDRGQMLKGAGYAAAVLLVGLRSDLLVIWVVGLLLPEESKQAPDPNTWSSSLEQPLTDEQAARSEPDPSRGRSRCRP
jgi:hypothetical protein